MPKLSPLRKSRFPFYSHAGEEGDSTEGVPDETKPFLASGLESPSPTEESFGARTDENDRALQGTVPTRSVGYLIALSVSITGLAFAFSIQLAESTKFLTSIGVSPAVTSLIWLVPPLCGSLLQPCFGAWSDASTLSLGKRRPFIVGGGFGLALSLIGFAWSEEIAAVVFHEHRSTAAAAEVGCIGGSSCLAVQIIATLFLVAINVCIQPLQNGIRALMVDCCPAEQQTQGNAWGSRVAHVSNCLLYAFAYVDLPDIMPWLGRSQLKGLSTIAAVTLGVTIGITCVIVGERRPEKKIGHGQRRPTILAQAVKAFDSLSKYLKRVFAVQFICWFSWFPFMVYITTHISEAYYQNLLLDISQPSRSSRISLRASASRSAALSLLGLSVTGLITSLLLPPLYHCFSPTFRYPHVTTDRLHPQRSSSRFSIQIPGLTLRRIWMTTQTLYALCTLGILVVNDPLGKAIVASIVGVNWAVLTWVPAALVNVEILRMKEMNADAAVAGAYTAISTADSEERSSGSAEDSDEGEGGPVAMAPHTAVDVLELASRSEDTETQKIRSGQEMKRRPSIILDHHHDHHPGHRRYGAEEPEKEQDQNNAVGTVLGINNVYIAAPQIVGLLCCSAIFWLLGTSDSQRTIDEGVKGTEWVIGLGGIASLGAVGLLWGVEERG